MPLYTLPFANITIRNVPEVGGKNASLGEMYRELTAKQIDVPDGFATTAGAFRRFLADNHLHEPIRQQLARLDTQTFANLPVL
jgi:pyruvate,water dikinase